MNKNLKIILISLAILVAIGIAIPFLILGNGTDTSAADDEATTSDSLDAVDREIRDRREALLREQDLPADYLDIKIDPKKNLLGESVIEGEIRNKATGTRYKDIELMMYWEDEAGAVMDSAAEIVFQSVDPGETITFKTKRKGPRKSKAIEVKVRGAAAAEQ